MGVNISLGYARAASITKPQLFFGFNSLGDGDYAVLAGGFDQAAHQAGMLRMMIGGAAAKFAVEANIIGAEVG